MHVRNENLKCKLKPGKFIGRVIGIPVDAKECRGKYLSVKIQIELNKPLKRFIKLAVDDSEKVVVAPLIYERLPEFCYACGKLGHVLKECSDYEARIEALEGASTKFGAWMRASRSEIGKSKVQKQVGRNSSEQEGKSKSTSDGSTKEVKALRIRHNQTNSAENAESGGSVEKLTGRNENPNYPTEKPSGLSQDRISCLDDSPLVNDINDERCDHWALVRGLEKESESDIVVMEEIGIYLEGTANVMNQSSYE
ncbi:hypothetical protein LWI28_025616 [Acer negundo]|uniref:CCHC-type domain-containing protein n=1 Tax=Acer negundo TaxID=4023 RepID=A0AAD5J6N7_ACENE|nr:hypothetical protein LWI28_025616 [Acer negundo]